MKVKDLIAMLNGMDLDANICILTDYDDPVQEDILGQVGQFEGTLYLVGAGADEFPGERAEARELF
jgi:hypothetical protein